MKILNKLKYKFSPHYVVIGKNTKEIIGCCIGGRGRAEVLSQELGATFKRHSRKSCPICYDIKQLRGEHQ